MAPKVDERRHGWVASDELWVLEVVLVVCAGATTNRERN